MVSFVASGNFYFYKDYEKACAFLLDSYFDDNEVTDEKEVIAINNLIADNGYIEDYGYIDEVEFED